MRKFYVSLSALVVVLSGVLLLNVFNGQSQAALPRDCDENSVIYCGAVNAAELKDRYNENKKGDLPTIYNSYGISADEMRNAGSKAKMGEVHKDGRVTVNGETVATGARSIGRQQKSGDVVKMIGGKKYYDAAPNTSFRSESIAAFVFFDANGQFKAFVITSCGNPGGGTPVPPKPKPSYKCISLAGVPSPRNKYEYDFTAKADAKDGASIVSYTFNYGDGSSETKQTNATTATASHTYQKAGSYVAKVTANVKVGNETKPATAPLCEYKVKIDQPKYKCESLTLRTLSQKDNRYAFDLKYVEDDGAKLKTVDYEFGDGTGQTGVTPEGTKSVEHTYQKAGTYTTTATLHFEGADVKDQQCTVTITISPEMCPLNPQFPKDDERCTPCPVPGKENLPKDSDQCVTPPVELPKTGPADFLAGGLGVSSLLAAGYYWFSSRRDLLTALLNR